MSQDSGYDERKRKARVCAIQLSERLCAVRPNCLHARSGVGYQGDDVQTWTAAFMGLLRCGVTDLEINALARSIR
jgi:hypothetical protein